MMYFLVKKDGKPKLKIVSPQVSLIKVPKYILSDKEMGLEVKEKVNLDDYELDTGEPIPENLKGYKLYYL